MAPPWPQQTRASAMPPKAKAAPQAPAVVITTHLWLSAEELRLHLREKSMTENQVQSYMAHAVKYCGGFGYKYLYEECHNVVVEALVNLD